MEYSVSFRIILDVSGVFWMIKESSGIFGHLQISPLFYQSLNPLEVVPECPCYQRDTCQEVQYLCAAVILE